MRRRPVGAGRSAEAGLRRRSRVLAAVACAVVAATALAGCTGSPAPSPTPSVSVERGIVYRTVDGQDLALDACLPAARRPAPALVLVHGGGFGEGSSADLEGLCTAAANTGIAAFSVDYRLLPARYPAQVQDVGAAVDWIGDAAQQRRFRLNGSTAILGSSAGAVTAAELITGMPGTPALQHPLTGAVLLSGVYDFDGSLGDAKRSADFYVGCDDSGSSCAERHRAVSAIHFVHAGMAPVLLVNGIDEYIPTGQLREFAAALESVDAPHTVYVAPTKAHADAILTYDPDSVPVVAEFLRSVLPTS